MVEKIIFVDALLNRSSAQIFKILSESYEENFDFALVCPNNENSKWPYENPPKKITYLWKNNQYVRTLLNFFKQEQPSLIHFFFELRTFGRLSSAIKFPILLFFVKQKSKIIVTLYNPLITKSKSSWTVWQDIPIKIPRFVLKPLIKFYIRTICNLSDKIIVQNNVLKLGLVEYLGIEERKIDVMKNAVLFEKPVIDQKIQSKFIKEFQSKKVILFFGNISPRKGQHIAIDAFAQIAHKLPEYILVIAGKTNFEFKEYENELEKTIKKLNMESRILIVGFLENDEINTLFDIAEITLWPYLPTITGSGAFSFALQHNKLAVVSKIDTFMEILDGKGAIFVEPDNAVQLAEAVLRLANEKELREILQKELDVIAKSRSCENMAKNHLKIYQNVLNNRKG